VGPELMEISMSEHVRNIELLEKTMQFINDHEDKHDQNVWFRLDDNRGKAVTKTCETAACFAGWACLLSGYKHYGSYIFRKLVR
jgi:hypothetical protein